MAGQARRGTRGPRRSSRDDSWAPLAVASAAGSGSVTATSTTEPTATSLATRATYRHLLMKGMQPDEAANLTAFMAGIPIAEAHWTLRQVNQLLFLRRMQETGHFGLTDGTRAN
jgi:hypothetical protein